MLARRFILVAVLSLAGCDDLKDFRGSYSGRIIGGEFVRSCFRQDTELTLSFDPNQAVTREGSLQGPPNSISTDDGTFANTPLEPLHNMVHDPLSELDFPGPQRLRSYLLLARPSAGRLAGRDAMVVVSLLASESIEVRIIARPADDMNSCPADFDPTDGGVEEPQLPRREYFGLWRMRPK